MLSDVRLYVRLWSRYLFRKGYGSFAGFEKIKGFVASSLYRQRGRFARPFVHTAMGAIVAMGVALAPVLANSFPGIENTQVSESLQSSGIMEITDDGTATVVSDKVRDKVMEYVVQTGDTVTAIALKFGVSADTIRWENGLVSANEIKPGQTLRILPVTGVRHKVARGETIYTIAKKYDANPQAVVDFPFNTFSDNESFALAVGQDLIVPDGKKTDEIPWSPQLYVTQKTPNAGAVSATGNFVWPMGGVITQYFSWYHRGIDIATGFGTPIVAADAGKVVVAGWPDNSGYGNRVVIDHGNGYQTWYAHMSKIFVTTGQTVTRGAQLGLEGSTGRSTGPHLHFEVRYKGVNQSPLNYLK